MVRRVGLDLDRGGGGAVVTVLPLPGGERTEICSEIPGTVLRLEVAAGDPVAAGDAVALLESMKMEIPVLVDRAGTIAEVLVANGEAVAADRAIAILVPPTPGGPATRRAS